MSGPKREDMLRELELLPVWRERNPAPATSGTQTAAMSEAAPKPDVPAATMTSLPSDTPVEQPMARSSKKSAKPAAVSAHEPERMMEEIPETTVDNAQPAEKIDVPSSALSPMGEDRRDIIRHMGWPALQQAVEHCPACSLCRTRTKTVFGVGDTNADWLFVGEAPGAEEDRKGEPFVGQAGRLLDNMLAAIKLKRGDNVYIANVLKCRPPDNRDPQGEEVQQCDPYLKRQVELIEPKLIVALGKFAAQSLLNSKASIASMRGKQHDYHGVPVIVTYHPAYLLRNMPDKAKAWEDLCYARETMQALQSAAATSSTE